VTHPSALKAQGGGVAKLLTERDTPFSLSHRSAARHFQHSATARRTPGRWVVGNELVVPHDHRMIDCDVNCELID
jgi:hypothetical protein